MNCNSVMDFGLVRREGLRGADAPDRRAGLQGELRAPQEAERDVIRLLASENGRRGRDAAPFVLYDVRRAVRISFKENLPHGETAKNKFYFCWNSNRRRGGECSIMCAVERNCGVGRVVDPRSVLNGKARKERGAQ